MLMEDYYGFVPNSQDQNQARPRRSSNKTQRSSKQQIFIRKSPNARTLKRTQLSKQKIRSRDSKNERKLIHPQLKKQTIKQSLSGVKMTVHQQDRESKAQQMEVIVKKYENYNNINSYQFKQPTIDVVNSSPPVNQSSNQDSYYQRGYRFEKQIPSRRHRQQNENADYDYNKHYRSLSKLRNQQFINHFQRQQTSPRVNPIQRYVQNQSNNDIRAKKSRSLGAKLRPHKMHTFYNAQRKQYYNYNQQGYLTDRQYELLNRIEEKALKAFQRANVQESVNKQPQPKKEKPSKQFQIQQSSRIRHRNSRILAQLKRDSSYADTPLSSRKQSTKKIQQQRIMNLSINPKKQVESQYDDYQMKISSKNDGQNIDTPIAKQTKKDIFHNFARQQSINDSSLLQFKPIRPQNQAEQLAKKSSQISNDYKSIDMMQINSNYKPTTKQIKQRNDFIIQDNRSLGMDTIRNRPNNEKKPEQKAQNHSNQSNSDLSISKSNSKSSNSSRSIQSSSISQSKNVSSKQLIKKRQSNAQSKVDSEQKLDFAKNKAKKSYSMSQPYSQSSIHDNIQKIEKVQSNKDAVSNFKKINPLTESQRLGSNNSISLQANSSNNSQKVKIKRLVKQSDKSIKQPIELPSSQSNMGALGVQSFTNYEKIQPIQIKINTANKSKISERSPISEMQLSNHGSKIKSRQALNSSFNQRSQASVCNRSRMRGSNYNGSNLQYDLFGVIRDFLQQEQECNQIRRAKQVRELISDELDDVLAKIEDHLYILNCITEIILLVPEVYDFQTIYDKDKDWIFFQTFLTFKKYIFQRNRVVIALKAGRNCFNLLNYTIEDNILKKYLSRVEVKNVLQNLEQCNLKLDKIMNQFYSFLTKFNHQRFAQNPLINLKPFRMNDDLVILLTEYIEQVQTLKAKKAEQFKEGDISPDDQQQYNIMILLNERIFRLMEMTFIMANLGGKEIKAYEKEEDLFQDQNRFRTYLFQNEELFKQTVKYFK